MIWICGLIPDVKHWCASRIDTLGANRVRWTNLFICAQDVHTKNLVRDLLIRQVPFEVFIDAIDWWYFGLLAADNASVSWYFGAVYGLSLFENTWSYVIGTEWGVRMIEYNWWNGVVIIWSLFETNYYLVEESDRFYFLHPELLVVISIQIIPDTQPIVKQNVFI